MRRPRPPLRGLPALTALALCAGCSIRQLAVDGLADALEGSAEAYAREDDPELVRDALPFVLKTVEALLIESPDDEGLLLQACSGFTQYAYAFVELDALAIEPDDYRRAQELRDRALRLYLRARDYGLRGLELRHAGLGAELRGQPAAAAARLEREDLALAYWTAAAWGSAIGVGLDRPEIAADADVVRALLRRALALDADWDEGSIHEAMIAIESLPEAMGGSPERAREHFERAVALSKGRRASPYVGLAVGVSLPAQDAVRFRELIRMALAVDLDAEPSSRLANRLSMRRAELLLSRMDDLFLDPLPE